MRIRNIRINYWRHFENINIQLGDNAGLVCVVGANGTGKTHLLELIAACAHHLGVSQGIEIPRGDPFNDPHDFSLQFFIAPGVSNSIDHVLTANESFAQWDRTLTITSHRAAGGIETTVNAGGIADTAFASQVVDKLRQSQDVHFLSLDADRAYPNKKINVNEVAQAYEIDWAGMEYTRGRSYRTTTTLYDEWIKYFLARENQAGTNLIKEIRLARLSSQQEPVFLDHFYPYKEALKKVLPHIIFTGVDSKKRTLLFDTTGLELSFNQLSGGEREIAFLIGQIDRFGLRQGLFLLDEPELHLNADLIRSWVAYLTSTVAEGQIWLATHSLEAVEAAGQQATFVLERNEKTRKVDSLARLDARPVLSALSRAVGTPAFSVSQLIFVFVEGEENVGERERYRMLAGAPQNVRFMECGSCNEVLRRVSAIRTLANETYAEIRIGGVVDSDFRASVEVQTLKREHGVFVLPVHEIENFFLHPQTLTLLLAQNGREKLVATELIQAAADARAGSWIFQRAFSTPNTRALPAISVAAKDYAKGLTWAQFDADLLTTIESIVSLSGFEKENQEKLKSILAVCIKSFGEKRNKDDFWKICEGKQVLNSVAQQTGFSGAPALIQAAFAAWSRKDASIPAELAELRAYLEGL